MLKPGDETNNLICTASGVVRAGGSCGFIIAASKMHIATLIQTVALHKRIHTANCEATSGKLGPEMHM